MEIRPISPHTVQLPPQETALVENETSWKVNLYVVTSRLLLGLGIALACAVPYLWATGICSLATALLAPVLPIAFGVLGLQTVGSSFLASGVRSDPQKLAASPSPPFLGIRNKNANCWLNGALQVLFQMDVLNGKIPEELAFLQRVRDDYIPESGKNPSVSRVNSQEVREELAKLLNTISGDAHVQDDPSLIIAPILDQMGKPIRTTRHEITTLSSGEMRSACLNLELSHFDLSHYIREVPGLHEAFENFFHSKEVTNGDEGTTTTYAFTYLNGLPDEFIVYLRGTYTGFKLSDPKEIPLSYIFSSREGETPPEYKCTGFLCHLGNSPESGHWIAYLEDKEGGWWEINDSRVRQIPLLEVQDLLSRDGAIAYYKKR